MASREVTKLIVGLILAPVVGWLSTTKRGNRILAWMIVATLLLIGVASIATQRFTGRLGAGVMTGDTAIVFGTVISGISLYLAPALVATSKHQPPQTKRTKSRTSRHRATRCLRRFLYPRVDHRVADLQRSTEDL